MPAKKLVIAGSIALLLIAGVATVFLWRPWEEPQHGSVSAPSLYEPIPEIGRGNTHGNIVNSGDVAQSGDWVYYVAREVIFSSLIRVNKLTMEEEVLVERSELGEPAIRSINVVGDWVFMSKDSGTYRMHVSGAGLERLNDGVALAYSFNVVDGWIYFADADMSNPSMVRMRINGTGIEAIFDGRNYDINITDDLIFFRNGSSDLNIYRMNIDGSELTRLNDDDSIRMNVVDGWVYYINRDSSHAIYRMRTDGTENHLLAPVETSVINVFDGWIYFNNFRNNGYLYRMRIDGTGTELVSEHPTFTIFVVEGWIYFRVEDPINFHLGNLLTAPLARIRKNGTDFEFLDQAISVEMRFSQ
jgi:hypothetical protein